MKLQNDEKVLHELNPEKNILVIWFFTKCLSLCLSGSFISMFPRIIYLAEFKNVDPSFWQIAAIPIFVVFPVLLIISLSYCVYLRKTYIYTITNQRCVLHKGIIRRIERSIPYHKVTDVERSQNIVERILGISSLNIFTPGTGSMSFSPYGGGGQRAEISFIGLEDNETPAETINEILRKFKATGE